MHFQSPPLIECHPFKIKKTEPFLKIKCHAFSVTSFSRMSAFQKKKMNLLHSRKIRIDYGRTFHFCKLPKI